MAEKTKDICTECGKKREVVIVDEVTRLCEDCIDELDYVLCDHCGEYWLADIIEFYTVKNNGNTICEHCYEMLLDDGEITEDDVEA